MESLSLVSVVFPDLLELQQETTRTEDEFDRRVSLLTFDTAGTKIVSSGTPGGTSFNCKGSNCSFCCALTFCLAAVSFSFNNWRYVCNNLAAHCKGERCYVNKQFQNLNVISKMCDTKIAVPTQHVTFIQ